MSRSRPSLDMSALDASSTYSTRNIDILQQSSSHSRTTALASPSSPSHSLHDDDDGLLADPLAAIIPTPITSARGDGGISRAFHEQNERTRQRQQQVKSPASSTSSGIRSPSQLNSTIVYQPTTLKSTIRNTTTTKQQQQPRPPLPPHPSQSAPSSRRHTYTPQQMKSLTQQRTPTTSEGEEHWSSPWIEQTMQQENDAAFIEIQAAALERLLQDKSFSPSSSILSSATESHTLHHHHVLEPQVSQLVSTVATQADTISARDRRIDELEKELVECIQRADVREAELKQVIETKSGSKELEEQLALTVKLAEKQSDDLIHKDALLEKLQSQLASALKQLSASSISQSSQTSINLSSSLTIDSLRQELTESEDLHRKQLELLATQSSELLKQNTQLMQQLRVAHEQQEKDQTELLLLQSSLATLKSQAEQHQELVDKRNEELKKLCDEVRNLKEQVDAEVPSEMKNGTSEQASSATAASATLPAINESAEEANSTTNTTLPSTTSSAAATESTISTSSSSLPMNPSEQLTSVREAYSALRLEYDRQRHRRIELESFLPVNSTATPSRLPRSSRFASGNDLSVLYPQIPHATPNIKSDGAGLGNAASESEDDDDSSSPQSFPRMLDMSGLDINASPMAQKTPSRALNESTSSSSSLMPASDINNPAYAAELVLGIHRLTEKLDKSERELHAAEEHVETLEHEMKHDREAHAVEVTSLRLQIERLKSELAHINRELEERVREEKQKVMKGCEEEMDELVEHITEDERAIEHPSTPQRSTSRSRASSTTTSTHTSQSIHHQSSSQQDQQQLLTPHTRKIREIYKNKMMKMQNDIAALKQQQQQSGHQTIQHEGVSASSEKQTSSTTTTTIVSSSSLHSTDSSLTFSQLLPLYHTAQTALHDLQMEKVVLTSQLAGVSERLRKAELLVSAQRKEQENVAVLIQMKLERVEQEREKQHQELVYLNAKHTFTLEQLEKALIAKSASKPPQSHSNASTPRRITSPSVELDSLQSSNRALRDELASVTASRKGLESSLRETEKRLKQTEAELRASRDANTALESKIRELQAQSIEKDHEYFESIKEMKEEWKLAQSQQQQQHSNIVTTTTTNEVFTKSELSQQQQQQQQQSSSRQNGVGSSSELLNSSTAASIHSAIASASNLAAAVTRSSASTDLELASVLSSATDDARSHFIPIVNALQHDKYLLEQTILEHVSSLNALERYTMQLEMKIAELENLFKQVGGMNDTTTTMNLSMSLDANASLDHRKKENGVGGTGVNGYTNGVQHRTPSRMRSSAAASPPLRASPPPTTAGTPSLSYLQQTLQKMQQRQQQQHNSSSSSSSTSTQSKFVGPSWSPIVISPSSSSASPLLQHSPVKRTATGSPDLGASSLTNLAPLPSVASRIDADESAVSNGTISRHSSSRTHGDVILTPFVGSGTASAVASSTSAPAYQTTTSVETEETITKEEEEVQEEYEWDGTHTAAQEY